MSTRRSLNKFAEDLVYKAMLRTQIGCPDARHPVRKKPGHMIKNLSEEDREKVKELRSCHFQHRDAQYFTPGDYQYTPEYQRNSKGD